MRGALQAPEGPPPSPKMGPSICSPANPSALPEASWCPSSAPHEVPRT